MLKELAPYLATPSDQLVRTIRREKCHTIVCQEYEYPGFDVCVRLGRRLGLPVSGVFQGGDYQRGRLERVIRPFSMRACSGFIIATKNEMQRVRSRYSVPASKQERIFNPIDVDEMWRPLNRAGARASLGIPREARVAVWHGRVAVWQKGLDILLSAWEQVCCERPGKDLRLLLVGTGQDAEELQQRIAAMPVRNVQWIDEYILDRARMRAFFPRPMCICSCRATKDFPWRRPKRWRADCRWWLPAPTGFRTPWRSGSLGRNRRAARRCSRRCHRVGPASWTTRR